MDYSGQYRPRKYKFCFYAIKKLTTYRLACMFKKLIN